MAAGAGRSSDGILAKPAIAVLAIAVLCVGFYSNTWSSPFHFDDAANIEDNRYVRVTELGLRPLHEAGFKSPSSSRPVANVSFALNYYLAGYDVTGYHAVNLLVHFANGVLVYFLALVTLRLSGIRHRERIALFAALVFTAHPVQTQAVTYIVQRMSSLAAMFTLLALLLFVRGRLGPADGRRWALWAGSFASWLLALGSKQNAITLPVVILLYEWFFFRDLSSDWLRRNSKIFLGLAALLVGVALLYLRGDPGNLLVGYADRDFTPTERVLTQLRVVVFYISLLVFPAPSRLNLIHAFPTSHSLFDPITTLLCLLLLIGLLALAIALARNHRLVSFCMLWFFVHLAVESSVVSLEMAFEHRLYLPLVGFALFASWLLFSRSSKKQSLAGGIAVCVVAALGAATYVRNETWRDGVTLWSDVLAKNPRSHRGHYNLGVQLEARGRIDEAARHYTEAIRIAPRFAEAHNNLGTALAGKGRGEEAIRHYNAALEIDPEFAKAHNNLGMALSAQGRFDEAEHHYAEALRLVPDYAKAHNNLGVTLARQGRLEEASRQFAEALRVEPDYPEARKNLEQASQLMTRSRPRASAVGGLPESPEND
jgi:tetratricopeptide (TPR) repeat protein